MIFDISGRRTPLSVEEAVGRILVVEDDQDIAELIAHHLGKAGYESEVVHTGDTVLSLVQDKQPSLIILDLMLPGQNGLDICRAIGQILVLLMSRSLSLQRRRKKQIGLLDLK